MAVYPRRGRRPWDTELKAYIDGAVVHGSAELSGLTVDTNQPFRIIMFSNGEIKTIPLDTPDPVAPTNLAGTPRLSSVLLTWTASASEPFTRKSSRPTRAPSSG